MTERYYRNDEPSPSECSKKAVLVSEAKPLLIKRVLSLSLALFIKRMATKSDMLEMMALKRENDFLRKKKVKK